MKLDTSSYYPKSTLDDEEEVELTSDIEETSVHNYQIAPEINDADDDDEETEENGYERGLDHIEPQGWWGRLANNLSTFLSWVLVPILMPVYGLLAALNLSLLVFLPIGSKLILTLVTVVLTIAAPAILILLLKKMGMVSEVGLNKRKERFIPYLICIICLVATAWFLWQKGAPMWLVMFFMGGALGGAINTVITFWWKISAHAAGAAGISALLLRIMQEGVAAPATEGWFVTSVMLAGLLGTARVWLGRHTVMQVLCGYLSGFLSVYLLTMIH